jgi:hypothetical protein
MPRAYYAVDATPDVALPASYAMVFNSRALRIPERTVILTQAKRIDLLY